LGTGLLRSREPFLQRLDNDGVLQCPPNFVVGRRNRGIALMFGSLKFV
jgi:hypothetical protein